MRVVTTLRSHPARDDPSTEKLGDAAVIAPMLLLVDVLGVDGREEAPSSVAGQSDGACRDNPRPALSCDGATGNGTRARS